MVLLTVPGRTEEKYPEEGNVSGHEVAIKVGTSPTLGHAGPRAGGHGLASLCVQAIILAAKVLARTDPVLAKKIWAAMRSYGVQESGKIEILFGEAKKPLPFRHYRLVDVR